jgi:alpha-galactosidase
MGSALTRDGWTFAAGSTQTTAEVIDALYGVIRGAAGDSLIIGCNTVSHLSAGHFEICRVGDDTSGTEWSRTRKMGVNTLAFRGPQHGAFYIADADCVGVTNTVPWSFNRQWLDLLARSGTMLFVSLAPDALGADQRRDLKEALALAATPQPLGEPLDWQRTVYPARWRLMDRERTYDWVGADWSRRLGDGRRGRSVIETSLREEGVTNNRAARPPWRVRKHGRNDAVTQQIVWPAVALQAWRQC